MSVMDQIRKLDEQKAALLETAKKEAMEIANKGLAALSELGFHYKLTPHDGTPAPTGTRRTGIRVEVLGFIKAKPGIGRAEILEKMNAKGDKSAEQSVSNALSALKKDGLIGGVDGGGYKAK
ncbi:MAG: hypothetical protein JWN66_3722 [Sphingomonas bacterium]|uniref:hypothetical protein n=1 Tax=Sphingomonas bacterium TaxID=1895847 RepID=UPI0026029AFA|nr:hypothetical protein [Sphingomonas bacterium]MDB5706606.1 hypothetical protein [Sphingomonas bacterium]